MRLYHFTHRQGIEGIISTGTIKLGKAPTPTGLIESFGVSLTTDLSPDGHGLPDGRLITEEQKATLGAWSVSPEGVRCVDHTAYRICLEIADEDPELVSFLKLPHMNDQFALATDISAYCPVDIHVDDKRMYEVRKQLLGFPALRKSPTWWFYLEEIAFESILAVGVRNRNTYMVVERDLFCELLRSSSPPKIKTVDASGN